MWQAFVDGFTVLSVNRIVVLGTVLVTCLGCSISFWLSQNPSEEKTRTWQGALLPGSFFAISLILRLAYISQVFVPPYFDSVEHYRIVKQILISLETTTFLETLPRLIPTYYHLGFHFLVSLLAFGLRADPIDVILVLGQSILAAIPLPLFFLVRQTTRSEAAAFLSMLLAGFGWYMPGFAINWGKYPALAGLLAFEIVLVSAYSITQRRLTKSNSGLIGFLLLGVIVSTLFHTRTLVILAVSLVSWILAGKLSKLMMAFQYFSLGILFAGLSGVVLLVAREPLLNFALDPYLADGIWITLIVLALSPFALMKFPRGFYFTILFILSVLIALFVPVDLQSPGLENQTLLDRPFAEMVLYLPLSVLGGLGLAGLLQVVHTINAISEKKRFYTKILTTLLFLGITSLISLRSYAFFPSECCQFVKHDDTIALDWLHRNLPLDAQILIAATPMHVLPSGPAAELTGTDAGIWIPALTGRRVSLAPFDTDFRSENTLEQLCQIQVDYIYIGGTQQSFNASQMQTRAGWYEKLLSLPNAQLYRLMGCTG